MIQEILREDCAEQYAAYQPEDVNVTAGRSSLVIPVVGCVLEQFMAFGAR
jgi:hypothetical protein